MSYKNNELINLDKSYSWDFDVDPINGIPMCSDPLSQLARSSFNNKIVDIFRLIVSNFRQPSFDTNEKEISYDNLLKKIDDTISNPSKYHDMFSHVMSLLNELWDYLEPQEQKKSNSEYGLEVYDEQYKTINRPILAEHFHRDDIFGYWRVAGHNPVSLFRINELPKNFPLTEEQYQSVIKDGDTLRSALNEDRAYLLDYKELTGTVVETGVSKPDGGDGRLIAGYSYAPIALFVVSKTDKKLMPVAIQCGQDPLNDNPIFLPIPDEKHRWGWERAKYVIQAADESVHQMYSHLGLTHLVIEAFNAATRINLSTGHQIYKLLITHFEGTSPINFGATKTLLQEGQYFDNLFAMPLTNVYGAVAKKRLNFDFYGSYFPIALASRGVDNRDAFPDYPYRDDGILIWDAIYEWVGDYVDLYYLSSYQLQSDKELMQWVADINKNAKLAEPLVVDTPEELKGVLTMIIFTASAQHAAVNFAQPDWLLYLPAICGTMEIGKPLDPRGSDQLDWLRILPSVKKSQLKIMVYTLLGSIHHGYLGEYYDPNGKRESVFDDIYIIGTSGILNKFRKRLDEIEGIINERNRKRLFPYKYMLPKLIPASINI